MGNRDNKTYSDFESAFNSAANNALSVIISSIQQCMDPASKNASPLVPCSSILVYLYLYFSRILRLEKYIELGIVFSFSLLLCEF